jgi:hypothetical protein
MRKSITMTLATLLLAALVFPFSLDGSCAGQQASDDQAMNFTVEGKITKHVGQKLTLSTEANIIFHVVYSDKTQITAKDGSVGSSKDLRVRVRIHVDGELTEAGEIIAQKIAIQAESAGDKR